MLPRTGIQHLRAPRDCWSQGESEQEAGFDYGGRLTEAVLLGNISVRDPSH